MTDLILTIGDKSLSSWSLRPWLILKMADIPFQEDRVRLDAPTTRDDILKRSPAGKVPSLNHGGLTIWDSLAIAEYLAESFPEKRLWPEDKAARAEARAISAEMHSGFAALRAFWPMNFTRIGLGHLRPPPVQQEIDRIVEIWVSAREKYGTAGPFLFGAFSIADAMYAPVVSRFMTYGPGPLPALAEDYMRMIFALPAMEEWGAGAEEEGRARA